MAEAFEPVKLRAPDGGQFTAHTPRELNDLVFGHGYKVVGKATVAQVVPVGTDDDGQPQTAAKPAPAKQGKESTGG